ncbi:MAG: hypothetical protein JST50_02605 [Bacteroidetes bacterium]|nr:hypothetical protein [Bacteroidota bacterium]
MQDEINPTTDPFDMSGASLKTRIKFWYFDVKNRIRKFRPNWEKFIISLFIWLALISMTIGLVIFIVYLVKLSNKYTIKGNNVNVEDTGQVGDFIGGTVGAIWSLTGALLFYATLRLQSKELIESRKQFETSRITDILYKQLEFFNSQTALFELKDIENDPDTKAKRVYKGSEALNLIRIRMDSIIDIPKDQKNEDTATIGFLGQTFGFIELNLKELSHIYSTLNTHSDIVRTVLIKEDIPPVELNELKSLFFKNIGEDFLHASENFIIMIEAYITFKESQGEKFDMLFSTEHKLVRSIESIKNFRLKNYDRETIKKDLKNREFMNTTHF